MSPLGCGYRLGPSEIPSFWSTSEVRDCAGAVDSLVVAWEVPRHRHSVKSGLRMMFIGAAAKAMSFGIGKLVGVSV